MSFLSRLFGREDEGSLTRGIALYEEGDFAGAANLLREVADNSPPDSGSLIDFHLRQALVHQGKSLLEAGSPEDAVPWFDEVTNRWPSFPDLHFWHGLCLGQAGRWPDALGAARLALRYNGDYIEARVLEAASLRELSDEEQAADSLSALVASGLRVEHPLIRFLAAQAPFSADSLPDNLLGLLHDASGDMVGRPAAREAVRLCQTGCWDEGIAKLRELCEVNPTYPDFRVKLAAALFQTGDNDAALDEVGQALILNPRYRTAAHLKALILADQHRFSEALDVVEIQPDATDPVVGHPGEELFCSYLSAALFLLTGRFSAARLQLDHWQSLTMTFPTAQLLLAAVDDLSGDGFACLQRLRDLAETWEHDENYQHYLGCQLLRLGEYDELERHLKDTQDRDDESLGRHEFLTALLQLERAEPLKAEACPPGFDDEPSWRVLRARDAMVRGRWLEALGILRGLGAEEATTERLSRMVLRCYIELEESGDVPIPDAAPDSVLQHRLCLLHRQERTAGALATIRKLQELHPDDLRWTWLDPTFWLTPIRSWIG